MKGSFHFLLLNVIFLISSFLDYLKTFFVLFQKENSQTGVKTGEKNSSQCPCFDNKYKKFYKNMQNTLSFFFLCLIF